jgi:penicillin-insensitive murein DD-endopeptidase
MLPESCGPDSGPSLRDSFGVFSTLDGRAVNDRPVRSPRLLLLLVACLPTTALATDRELPDDFRVFPFTERSLSLGHPNAGFQVRSKRLRPSKVLTIKRGSEEHAFGHPALILMLQRTARQMNAAVPGSTMLVGDLSKEQGGALYGHFSHQSGRDADVGFYARDAKGNVKQLKDFVRFDANGKAKDGSGLVFDDYRNWLLVQSWVKDERAGLSHIFVSYGLRARLLRFAKRTPEFAQYLPQAIKLLKQPEHASPHDDHFHVRISCPKELLGHCRNESKRH